MAGVGGNQPDALYRGGQVAHVPPHHLGGGEQNRRLDEQSEEVASKDKRETCSCLLRRESEVETLFIYFTRIMQYSDFMADSNTFVRILNFKCIFFWANIQLLPVGLHTS